MHSLACGNTCTRRLTCTRSHAQYTTIHAYMHAGVMMQQSKYRATVESNILQAMRCDCTLLHSHKHHDHHDRSNTAVSSRPLDLNFLFLCVLNMLMHASVRVCVQICASGLFAPEAMRSSVVPFDTNVYEELLQVMPHACLYE